ncbi:MAG: HAMP domain-containing sensor histidine kinase [Desulfobacteraceae bacterium]|jgi:signal transduction histidine kinase
MIKPQTLNARIIFFFCGYLTILLLIYSSALIIMFRFAEDMVFKRQLTEISGSVKEHMEKYGKMPLDLPRHISVFQDLPSIPQHLRSYIISREPGIIEINGDDFNYHAAILKIQPGNRVIYILYDTGTIEANERFESIIILALLVLTSTVVIIGLLLAKSVSNRILNPIIKLAKEVEALAPDDTSTRLHYTTAKDEVGTLVRTINQLLGRISEFTRREREFTAHASHELRTPVTVIKGAVEIIKNRNNDTKSGIKQPLSRVERAVSEMEKLIETFLLLARQGQKPGEDESCDLSAVIKNVLDACLHILGNKPVDVNLNIPDSQIVQAPASLVSIAVGNLVRNAFMYTGEGKVDVSAYNDRVVIKDSGPGIDPAQEGKGLGLTIVKRICERLGWQFKITSHRNGGTCAELVFG